ncbi:hypothetical protein G9A89_002362 [Geosiphon pyriformis]|nr:hypothetical protein G9A89_002362 [Geosiphon pyriformis]
MISEAVGFINVGHSIAAENNIRNPSTSAGNNVAIIVTKDEPLVSAENKIALIVTKDEENFNFVFKGPKWDQSTWLNRKIRFSYPKEFSKSGIDKELYKMYSDTKESMASQILKYFNSPKISSLNFYGHGTGGGKFSNLFNKLLVIKDLIDLSKFSLSHLVLAVLHAVNTYSKLAYESKVEDDRRNKTHPPKKQENTNAKKFIRVITLGQPRIGNKDFVEFINMLVLNSVKSFKIYRVTYNNDIVPRLPLEDFIELRHHDTEYWIPAKCECDEYTVYECKGEQESENPADTLESKVKYFEIQYYFAINWI